jgi:hypothetical protein
VVKNLFRHRKARYKGLAKNAAQMFSLFGLANIVIAKGHLLALHAQRCLLSAEVRGETASKGFSAAVRCAQRGQLPVRQIKPNAHFTRCSVFP